MLLEPTEKTLEPHAGATKLELPKFPDAATTKIPFSKALLEISATGFESQIPSYDPEPTEKDIISEF